MANKHHEIAVLNPDYSSYEPLSTSPLKKVIRDQTRQLIYGIPGKDNFFGRMFQILPGFTLARLKSGSLYVAELQLTPASAAEFLTNGFSTDNWEVIERAQLMSYHGSDADILKVLNLTDPSASLSTIQRLKKSFEDYSFALSISDYGRMARSFPRLTSS